MLKFLQTSGLLRTQWWWRAGKLLWLLPNLYLLLVIFVAVCHPAWISVGTTSRVCDVSRPLRLPSSGKTYNLYTIPLPCCSLPTWHPTNEFDKCLNLWLSSVLWLLKIHVTASVLECHLGQPVPEGWWLIWLRINKLVFLSRWTECGGH